jgi:hypothetical protein
MEVLLEGVRSMLDLGECDASGAQNAERATERTGESPSLWIHVIAHF